MIKLLKNDFISTGRIMGVIYLIVIGVSTVTLLTKSAGRGVVSAIGMLILIAIALVLTILTTVFVLIDFQKTLYGDQGYLTFTLPVKSWKILASKVIVSGAWYLIDLAAIVGIFIVIAESTKELMGDNYDEASDLIQLFFGNDIESLAAMIFLKVILVYAFIVFFTNVVFFTNTLSNTKYLQKHSILYTLLFFIPIAYATLKLADFFDSKLAFSVFFIEGSPKFVAYGSEYYFLINAGYTYCDVSKIIVFIVLGIALFFATHTIMKKFVNIR